jgi:hypothetical protein
MGWSIADKGENQMIDHQEHQGHQEIQRVEPRSKSLTAKGAKKSQGEDNQT